MEAERVQSIAAGLSATDELPEDFIRPENERPGTTKPTFVGLAPDVPVIDLSDPDREGLVRDMASAGQEWGIFQVVNHGIEAELIKRLQEVGMQFFQLPQEEKEKYATKAGEESLEGYGTTLQKDTTGKKAWVDFFFHIVWPPSRINYAIWPRNPTSYREVNEEYTKKLVGVVDEILRCLSLGLGLEGSVVKEKLGGQDLEFLLKINYYPPCPRPDLALGVVAHSDMSGITVLVPNDVTGLQVFKDDMWLGVKHIPNALIIHLGDQMEILSNGKYKSVYHRTTVNKEKTRMSWPVFCCPPGETMVGPLLQLVGEDNPPKFKTKKYKDYSYCKLHKLPQ